LILVRMVPQKRTPVTAVIIIWFIWNEGKSSSIWECVSFAKIKLPFKYRPELWQKPRLKPTFGYLN
jgi:hypothetical protein